MRETTHDDHLGFDCPSELKERARAAAQRRGRTLSGWARKLLRDRLETIERLETDDMRDTSTDS